MKDSKIDEHTFFLTPDCYYYQQMTRPGRVRNPTPLQATKPARSPTHKRRSSLHARLGVFQSITASPSIQPAPHTNDYLHWILKRTLCYENLYCHNQLRVRVPALAENRHERSNIQGGRRVVCCRGWGERYTGKVFATFITTDSNANIPHLQRQLAYFWTIGICIWLRRWKDR